MAELRTIDVDDDGIRIDRWFKRHYPHVTHVLLEKLLRKGEIRLDGKRAKAADRIVAGQSMKLPPQVVHAKASEKPKAAEAQHPLTTKDMGSLADRILYMDKQVIVIDKPPGLATQGGPQVRVSSPAPGGSTLITSAPRSPSIWAHSGPASTRVRSRTRMPSSAPE